MLETAAWTCGASDACVTNGATQQGPANLTVPQDRGYVAVSALALAVEAAEALALSSPTVTSGLTAAVRPFERSVL
jgi:hypothetical protein